MVFNDEGDIPFLIYKVICGITIALLLVTNLIIVFWIMSTEGWRASLVKTIYQNQNWTKLVKMKKMKFLMFQALFQVICVIAMVLLLAFFKELVLIFLKIVTNFI